MSNSGVTGPAEGMADIHIAAGRSPAEVRLLPNGYPRMGNARDVSCPICRAIPGWSCRERRWTPRERGSLPLLTNKDGAKIYHPERWAIYRARVEEGSL